MAAMIFTLKSGAIVTNKSRVFSALLNGNSTRKQAISTSQSAGKREHTYITSMQDTQMQVILLGAIEATRMLLPLFLVEDVQKS
mgnify:FL=1